MDKFLKAVYNLDGERCMNPNCKFFNGRLLEEQTFFDAHHIIPKSQLPNRKDPLRFDPKNGIMLCRECHNSADGNSKRPLRGYVFIKWLLDYYKENQPDIYRWRIIQPTLNLLASRQKVKQK